MATDSATNIDKALQKLIDQKFGKDRVQEPTPEQIAQAIGEKLTKEPNTLNCIYCDANSPHPFDTDSLGCPVGDGRTLGKNIMKEKYVDGINTAQDHPLSVNPAHFLKVYNKIIGSGGDFNRTSEDIQTLFGAIGRHTISALTVDKIKLDLKAAIDANLDLDEAKHYVPYRAQAHHLICSETMTKEAGYIDLDWKEACYIFGYDINGWENGIFLPSYMPIACYFQIPLHQGNHHYANTNQLKADEKTFKRYAEAVKDLVTPILTSAKKRELCDVDNDDHFVTQMNDASKEIWKLIKNFEWLLTANGLDFSKGNGGCKRMMSWRETVTEKLDNDNKVIKDSSGNKYYEAIDSLLPCNRDHEILLELMLIKKKKLLSSIRSKTYIYPEER